MNRSQFEAEVADFCKLWLCDYIDDYYVGYNEYEDSIEACISLEAQGHHNYELTLIPHPNMDDDIAIRTYDDRYVEADGEGLYLCLWLETINQENALMEKYGLMRIGDGMIGRKYFVNGGKPAHLIMSPFMNQLDRSRRSEMNDHEIDILIQRYVEQTESGNTLDLATVKLIAKEVERRVRYRAEDVAGKAKIDIALLGKD